MFFRCRNNQPLMGYSRKLRAIAMSGFLYVNMSSFRISYHSLSSLSRLTRTKEDDSFWLRRLDHKDWLAPNEVLKIFNNLRNPDLIMDSFKKISSRVDYKPREALYSLLIGKLAHAHKFDAIDELLENAKSENCRLSDEFFYMVIKIYGNIANHAERAIETLIRMPEFHCWPTIRTFNYVLNMLVCTRQYEVIHELYMSAPKLGVTIDTCCFNILIKGLCQWNKLNAAFALLHEMPKQGCRPNATTYSTLMHSLCKHGRVNEAFELCEKMEIEGCYPDTIMFNILISGLCKRGKVTEGLEFLKKMKLKGCYPNSGTYQALLYGLLELKKFVEAKYFMGMMISEHKAPSYLSYKMTIEGLCGEKMLNEAGEVLQQMICHGFIPQMGTWKTVLECMFLVLDNDCSEVCYIESVRSQNEVLIR